MSRIGKLPVPIPDKVDVKIEGNVVRVKGPLGEMAQEVNSYVTVRLDDGKIICERKDDDYRSRAFHGLYRSLINNMVLGVSQGFTRELDIVGVGYRAELKGRTIDFQLGYSHPISFPLPEGVTAEVDRKANHIVLKGYNKQLLGQIAADIRRLRPPEPYKGKGIKYKGERIRRKAGKTAGK